FGEGGTAVLGLSHPACKLRPVGAAWEARRVAANGRRAQVSLSAMTATSAPTVRRHHWIVRLTHWATVIVLAGMIASGLQIYEAYARFGNRGGPYFVSLFDGAQFPHWSRLGGLLAGGLYWHLAVVTGFAVYKPTQLAWLTTLFGGFQAADYWHFWIVWIFVGFTIMHVILVFAVDPASLRAMLTGSYRRRFPSHD